LKKSIAISFLALFVCVNTDMAQLFKLPVLFHHYLEHQEDDHNQSFADFLELHYGKQLQHSDTEHHDHEKLPFKTSDCAAAHLTMAFVTPSLCVAPKPTLYPTKITPCYNGFMYSFSITSSIWQPPKFS
jgi:hypothetical protein